MTSEVNGFDLGTLFDRFREFLDSFFTDVMDSDFVGLMMYLYGCIPMAIRNFMLFTIVLVIILSLYNAFRHSK